MKKYSKVFVTKRERERGFVGSECWLVLIVMEWKNL
jgi:hypothetical protein